MLLLRRLRGASSAATATSAAATPAAATPAAAVTDGPAVAAAAVESSSVAGDSAAATATSSQASVDVAAASEHVIAHLKRFDPELVDGMDPSLHYLAPHLPKVRWAALGDLIAAREKSAAHRIDGSRWMSLRLDGCGFSKAVRLMRSKGILEAGFSETFACAMQSCLNALMEHFNGVVGYTQSDEMTVLIPPASVVRGMQQQHLRSGRVTKTATLAAGFATAHFMMALSKRCQQSGIGLDGLAQVLPHFDCRVGEWRSWEEARALLIWRAYDCSVNGVSDAVYHIPGSGKQIQSLGKREKVEWLWRNGHLPLPKHQAYGATIVKVKRQVEGFNPKTGEAVQCVRGVFERLEGPLLELLRTGALTAAHGAVSVAASGASG